jgi:hypothetical protein
MQVSRRASKDRAPLAYNMRNPSETFWNTKEQKTHNEKISEMTSIVYVPLSTEEKQIRTLILCSGKINDPIRCALRIVSLEEQPAYEALSYTWGDAYSTAPIEVDGARFDATVNLERALRHLRKTDGDLTLWVDAGT